MILEISTHLRWNPGYAARCFWRPQNPCEAYRQHLEGGVSRHLGNVRHPVRDTGHKHSPAPETGC